MISLDACHMKFLLITGLALLVSFPACKTSQMKGKNSPAEVSERFFALLKTMDYEKAMELGTDNTDRILKLIGTLSGMGGGINLLRDNKKELTGCEVSGDRAVCIYKSFQGPDEKVILIREKGRWLVDLSAQEP
jgi:hypothetical protein